MRIPLTVALLLGAATLAEGLQPPPTDPDKVPLRFGLRYRPKAYPQDTPKHALESVIEAVDQADYGYLVAHLLNPAFVDARVADRARQIEPVVEAELLKLREFQRANPDRVDPESRVPRDPVAFRAFVAERSRDRSYRQILRDVQERLADDLEVMKDLRRFARQGTYAESGAETRVGLPDTKDRSIFLKKVGNRWFMENRQTEDAKPPDGKKGPSEKK